MQVCASNMRACFVGSIFSEKQPCRLGMNPKRLATPGERGRDPEGYLGVDGGPVYLALGVICFTKETVTLGDHKCVTFIRKKTDRLGYGRRPSEALQRSCLPRDVIELFLDFRYLFCWCYPFLAGSQQPACRSYEGQCFSSTITTLSPPLRCLQGPKTWERCNLHSA